MFVIRYWAVSIGRSTYCTILRYWKVFLEGACFGMPAGQIYATLFCKSLKDRVCISQMLLYFQQVGRTAEFVAFDFGGSYTLYRSCDVCQESLNPLHRVNQSEITIFSIGFHVNRGRPKPRYLNRPLSSLYLPVIVESLFRVSHKAVC